MHEIVGIATMFITTQIKVHFSLKPLFQYLRMKILQELTNILLRFELTKVLFTKYLGRD